MNPIFKIYLNTTSVVAPNWFTPPCQLLIECLETIFHHGASQMSWVSLKETVMSGCMNMCDAVLKCGYRSVVWRYTQFICFTFPSTEILNATMDSTSDSGMEKSLDSQWKLMPRLSSGFMSTVTLSHASSGSFFHSLATVFKIYVFDILNVCHRHRGIDFLDREVLFWHMHWDPRIL